MFNFDFFVCRRGPLRYESRALPAVRGALLPKLLSGELRVPETKNGGAA
jgi:hypothetical protein